MKVTIRIACVAGLFYLASCHSTETNTSKQKTDTAYAIIGKVTGLDSGWIYIIHRQTGQTDSAALDHGFFKFSGKADTAEICRISLNDQAKSFFLENGKISMLIKKDSVKYALISGTPAQDEFNYFQNEASRDVTARMAVVNKAYDSADSKKNTRLMDSLDKIYTALDLQQKQIVMDYARSHASSIVSAFLVFDHFSYNSRLGQIDSLYQELDTTVRITYFGKQLQNIIDKMKLTAVGNPAPLFSCANADGKEITLASFKGKYTLIDFWASWCGPCRLENPNVVKAFHQFHDKGFEILGVSLDDTRSDWLQAIKKDQLNWAQVSDLKGWQSAPAALYGVKAIPMNFLIDKNGMIVAKDLRGEDLSGRLIEILH
jgi:peroxiredoxin